MRNSFDNGGYIMSLTSKLSIINELWEFLRVRKKWWLTPIVVILILFGLLIILTETTAVAPFIYALF
jgi:uncharacterized Rmd1/YagE family protein